MYPFDSQGKTENYRSCPSTLQKQRRAAPSRDLTVTRDIFYKCHCPSTPERGRRSRPGRGGGGGSWGAGLFFYVGNFCIFLVVTKKKGKKF